MKSEFAITKWEEKTYVQYSVDKKLTKASVVFDISGDFVGKAYVEYLMVYTSEATAAYIGCMRFEGHVGSKKGSFVVKDSGTFESGQCKSTLDIIVGSGTGDFEKVSGEGHYIASHTSSSLELIFRT